MINDYALACIGYVTIITVCVVSSISIVRMIVKGVIEKKRRERS